MTLWTFGANEPVTLAAMNAMSYQMPNSVFYGATRAGVQVTSTSSAEELVAKLTLDAVLGRYLLVVVEMRINPAGGGAQADFRGRVRFPGDLTDNEWAASDTTGTWTQKLRLIDTWKATEGGDSSYGIRGAKVHVEFYLSRTAGTAEMRNIVVMGGGSDDPTDYGY